MLIVSPKEKSLPGIWEGEKLRFIQLSIAKPALRSLKLLVVWGVHLSYTLVYKIKKRGVKK